MLYESASITVTATDGVATLTLAFPGWPANALDAGRATAIRRAVESVRDIPAIQVLVLRGRASGFCDGYTPTAIRDLRTDDDQTAFAVAGQRLTAAMASLDCATVALLDGPCLGPGCELAFACDYRLAVSGPDAGVGFPEWAVGLPPCWGGSAVPRALRGGATLTARQAYRRGLVDDVFTARRATVETRLFLDGLLKNPRKRVRPVSPATLAAERVAFREACADPGVRYRLSQMTHVERPPLPGVTAVVGTSDALARLAAEIAIRGKQVVTADTDLHPAIDQALADAVSAGRVTPLEADHARSRVSVGDLFAADLWLTDSPHFTPSKFKPGARVGVADSSADVFAVIAAATTPAVVVTPRRRAKIPA